MIIDFENHLYMEEQLHSKANSPSGRICERYWDKKIGQVKIRITRGASQPEKFLQFMDEAGIDMAVLTTNNISGLESMKKWNDFCAGVVKKYPKQFTAFACIPPFAGKPALDEVERAIKYLGMKGVHIWTRSTDGRHLDDRALWPFYEKVAKLGVPIDVHVTLEPTGFDAMASDYGLYFTLAREIDMCVATMRLCLGGVLEDFPDLVFIMNHFGGGISSMVERVDSYTSFSGSAGLTSFYKGKSRITRPWREYFNKLYFNLAGREVGIGAVKCALTTISPQRLVFGTDWPFNYDYYPQEVRRYVQEIRKLDLPPDAADDMLGGNAARLLKLRA